MPVPTCTFKIHKTKQVFYKQNKTANVNISISKKGSFQTFKTYKNALREIKL